MGDLINNSMVNDNSGRGSTNWSTSRNTNERLRHRPHISNTSNSRGEGYVQYYSSLDADILFGGVFIDEVVNISWQVQQNAMPIFGYNSYTFDDIALGARLIQGSFTVNFTEANYLSKVMATMSRISRKTYGKDNGQTSSFTANDRKIRNLPLWDKGFDIVVGYGEKTNKSATEYDQIVMLDCCQLTGCQQQLDYNGEPLLETYSFIARDMKFVDSQQYFLSESFETTIVTKEEETTESEIDIVTAKIDISGNNNSITIEMDKPIENMVSLYVMLSEINSVAFNVMIGMEGKDGKYSATLTEEQKKAVANYVSTTNLKKATCTGTYAMQKDFDIISKDLSVLVEINL